MIEVRFKRPTPDLKDYDVFATVKVADDGTYTFEGSEAQELTEVHILDPGRPGGQLKFAEDPYAWAQLCNRAFRTPYVVPEIIQDTSAPR